MIRVHFHINFSLRFEIPEGFLKAFLVNRLSCLRPKCSFVGSVKPCFPSEASSDYAVVERVFLRVVCPIGRGHTAIRVQQDAETSDDEQGQEDEEQQHEDEGGLLLQRQVGRHMMATPGRGQRTAEEALGHPGHIHA